MLFLPNVAMLSQVTVKKDFFFFFKEKEKYLILTPVPHQLN